MNYLDAMQAAEEAKKTQQAADAMLRRTAKLLRGRLQVATIDDQTLCRLKRELAKYNMHTGEWKE